MADGGAAFDALLDGVEAAVPASARHHAAAADAVSRLRRATRALLDAARGDPELPYRVAGDFLRATGLVLVVQAWARVEAVSAAPAAAGDAFHLAKCEAARHCMDYVRPELGLALAMLDAGRAPLAPVRSVEPA